MRILIIASGDLWAGAEGMVYQLVTGLNEIKNVALCVVLLNQGRLASELKDFGVEVHVVDETKYNFSSINRVIRKIVVDFSPDIIHSHRYKENLLAWLVAFGRHNIKLVATQHGMPEMAGSSQGVAGWFRTTLFFRLLSCCFNRTVLVSSEMRRALLGSYGFSLKDVAVIHNGICIPKSVISHSGKRVVIGSAGRLFPVKDFSLFVDIARQVIFYNENVYFMLAGDGPERTFLEKKIQEYGIHDRFIFSGHVNDIDSFYKKLDIYVNTSVHEGIPMSVLEAMSHGLPVVVPLVGGFPEIIEDGVSGFLIEGRDPNKFASKIFHLLKTDYRRHMGEAARQRVIDNFSREAMVESYYQLYQEVTAS